MLSGFDLCVAVANATKKIQDSQVDNKQQQHSLVKGKHSLLGKIYMYASPLA